MDAVVQGQTVMLQVRVTRKLFFTLKNYCHANGLQFYKGVPLVLEKFIQQEGIPFVPDELIPPPPPKKRPYRYKNVVEEDNQ